MRNFDYAGATTSQPPEPPKVVFSVNWLGAIIITANIAVAFLAYRAFSAHPIVAGAIAVSYYSLATPFMLGMVTGAIPYMVAHHQSEVTERLKIELQYELAGTRPNARIVEPLHIGGREPVAPLLGGDNFVSAVDDSVRNEAMAFVAQLYTAEGKLDANKIALSGGRIRCSMPGKAAIEYLISRGMVRVAERGGHPNGYLYDINNLPRRHNALNQI